ncbi:MAG: type III-B CRISPR-associated protein Cas10/Cmr2 [Hydrogenibacillus schlegelii]|uniref:Type III-B CRISPR-associated protein Cas10/Cmr2 n=1 Tax=Hydrogenibacillus schlegelii TaxID=1484 RepID=A0A947CU63_HYDSH|nr:type III-B CRISPR-associated protein Cas10/Cmr2 [Hydrogenibacillus schlegelii]
MSDEHLFLFHIGPVQDFIATARRSRDLWYGSWLLSELAKAAAREIVALSGGSREALIFPAPDRLDRLSDPDFSAPNRVLAVIDRPPKDVGRAVREAVLRRLGELREEAYRRIVGRFDRAVAVRQVDDFPELFWAAAPLSDRYDAARQVVEAAMSARKASRDFAPVTWGAEKPKCALDGARESVLFPEEVRTLEEAELYRRYGIQKGEHLCGVCLMKRHGRRLRPGVPDEVPSTFWSTSHVAALPLLERLTDERRSAVTTFIDRLRALGLQDDDLPTVRPEHPVFGPYDGELLFEERLARLVERSTSAAGPDEVRRRKKAALEALRKFLDEAFGEGSGGRLLRPHPYYALLVSDGDHMGRIIDAQTSPDQHRALSLRQSRFALRAAELVASSACGGSLIYSGGDDVLALVPLHRALDCAKKLSDTFRSFLGSFSAPDKNGRISPTLSVGLVIAHHLEPLSDVLDLARKTEKAAKSLPQKNALAITLSKRSGSQRTVRGRWGVLDERLRWLIELLRTGQLSDRLAYDLKTLARTLRPTDPAQASDLEEAARKEAVRLLRRKRTEGGEAPIDATFLQRLIDDLERTENVFAWLEERVDELLIAREIAAVKDLAGDGPYKLPDAEVRASGEGGAGVGCMDH